MSNPYTPRKSLGRPRPSIGNLRVAAAASAEPAVPPLPAALLSPTILARKQSFNQLTQNSSKDSGYGGDGSSDGNLEIGDSVNVPGGMYGVVKFVGAVKGKPGVFVGVELEGPHAVNGKNDGSVEGTRYFTTSTPHSGVFFPLNRARLRNSGSSTKSMAESQQQSPTMSITPSTPQPPSMSPKKSFARPSLPRPQSPAIPKTPGAGRPSMLSATPRTTSALSGRIMSPSPTPDKNRPRLRSGSISQSTNDLRGYSTVRQPTKSNLSSITTPSSRNLRDVHRRPSHIGLATPRASSSLSFHGELNANDEATPRSFTQMNGSNVGFARASQDEDKSKLLALQAQLSAKDHQLKEQANSLSEMESSLNELQSLLSETAVQEKENTRQSLSTLYYKEEESDIAQLKVLLREKSEKIEQLNIDFDAHRADFRSTIDTLEMAASETERVYEKRVEDLLLDCRELQRQYQELLEVQMHRDEEEAAGGVESVVRQLKQLEALVAELEEGLEDARRGEVEARAEAEHCRGESERAKEELRREREKANAFERRLEEIKKSSNFIEAEIERKGDEIRGLKSIIHSLSRDKIDKPQAAAAAGAANRAHEEALKKERQAKDQISEQLARVQSMLDEKTSRESELLREIQQLKMSNASQLKAIDLERSTPPSDAPPSQPVRASYHSHKSSTTPAPLNLALRRPSKSSIHETSSITSHHSSINGKPPAEAESPTTDMEDDDEEEAEDSEKKQNPNTLWCEICETSGHDILTCNNMFSMSKKLVAKKSMNELVAGKATGVVDESKWCALCEKDGHDSVDCPIDDF